MSRQSSSVTDKAVSEGTGAVWLYVRCNTDITHLGLEKQPHIQVLDPVTVLTAI